MKRTLKERFERLGPIRGIDRVRSGSAVTLILRPDDGMAKVRTIDLAQHLAKRGLSLLRAKRAVEKMLERREVTIRLPTVESEFALAADLKAAGVKASTVIAEEVDVRSVREQQGMTQEEFAGRYGIPLDVLQNWEQGRNKPDATANAYLQAISSRPAEVAEALEAPLAG